jgi:hypothetical protein
MAVHPPFNTYGKPVVNIADAQLPQANCTRERRPPKFCPLPHPLTSLSPTSTQFPPATNPPPRICRSPPLSIIFHPTHIRRLPSSQNRKSLTCPPNPNRRALLRQQVAEQRWTQQKRCANAAKCCEITLRPRSCVLCRAVRTSTCGHACVGRVIRVDV